MVEGGGFEPPKLTRQIYNLLPLATREPLLHFAVNSIRFFTLVKRKKKKTLNKISLLPTTKVMYSKYLKLYKYETN
jgi:hypothetical protein